MKTVICNAKNLRFGDVYQGRRILRIVDHKLRKGRGIGIVTINSDGYKLGLDNFKATDKVVVKRPKFNIGK